MKDNRNRLLLQYAGLATQLTVALAVAIYAGYRVDKKMALPIPLLVWVLPLLVLVAMIVKVIKDTSNK